MILDPISETRLSEVHPELSRRIHQLAALLSFPVRVTQGYRSYPQQAALYAQGRTAPGPIVTNAKPEQSAHCFLYAVDLVPMNAAGQPDWNDKDAQWSEMLAKAPSCGLAEGAEWRSFPDFPHFYLQELPATPDAELVYVFTEGGLAAVSQLLDTRLQKTT